MPGTQRNREIAKTKASLAGLKRCRPDDDPAVIEKKTELKLAVATDYLNRVVNEAPPLTTEQRSRLAVLLKGDAA